MNNVQTSAVATETDEVPEELAQFFAQAEQTEAKALLAEIGDGGGWLPLVEVLEAGHTTKTVADVLSHGTDKRQKPRAVAQKVGGVPVIILSATGWAEVGQPNRRPLKPRAERMRHTLAPRRCAAWLRDTVTERMQTWTKEQGADAGRIAVLASGTDIASWGAEVEAAAWARINTGAAGADVGALTRREAAPKPDLVVIEEWADASTVPRSFWDGAERPSNGQGGIATTPWTMRIGVEVETAAKATADLDGKLRRLQACIDLGVLDAVVWVVDDRAVAERLRRFGVGKAGIFHPMYYASTLATGIDPVGASVPPFLQDLPQWWAAQYAPATVKIG